MKILLLTKKLPYPLNDGESIAVSHMAKGLTEQGMSVDLLSFNTSKDYQSSDEIKLRQSFYNKIYTVDINNKVTLVGALVNLLTGKSYHISRFIKDEFSSVLARILDKNHYDIIQCESIYLSPYIETIREKSEAKIVLRTHNIEYLIWKRISKNENNLLKKAYLNIQSKRLENYEKTIFSQFDGIIPMSSVDLDEIVGYVDNQNVRLHIVPIYLDLEHYNPNHHDVNAISFIGSLDWMPNIEGLNWFFQHVLPKVSAVNSKLTFHIAGKNATNTSRFSHNCCVYHGEVESAISFIRQYSIFVVPLLSGSGIRVKILEAMALGKAVVSTSIGIEGIDALQDQDFVLANSPEEMAKAILLLQNDRERQKTLGDNARLFIKENYGVKENTKGLITFYKNILDEL